LWELSIGFKKDGGQINKIQMVMNIFVVLFVWQQEGKSIPNILILF